MTTAAACPTTNSVITVSDLNTVVNCEPRVHDLRLAEALGFVKRHMIRALIRRHLPTLKTFGEVSFTRGKPGERGGRPGTDYWLNEEQALFITAKSDTERAALVTVDMVRVFKAVRTGTPTTIPVRAHQRRLPSANLREGQGCVMLGGKLVFYSSGEQPRTGDSVLCVRRDGSLIVTTLPEQWVGDLRRWDVQPAFVMVEVAGPHPRGIVNRREQMAVVGVVGP